MHRRMQFGRAGVRPMNTKVTMTARVGPVSALFSGRIVLTDVVAPTSYTLSFDGQGGAAGFAKGQTRVALVANDPGTRVDYQATAQVGGKLAQIGSRLIDGAAAKVADDFLPALPSGLGSSRRLRLATPFQRPPIAGYAPRCARCRCRLVLAAVIIAAMAIYWLTRPA